jgi:ornithine carbamoyltransferase
MRHFIDLLSLTPEELSFLVVDTGQLMKAHKQGIRTPVLLGRVLGLVFEKPSLRTRVSFQTAIAQLGGTSVFLTADEVGLGSRESVPDFARVMSQYVDAVVLRTFGHDRVETFAANSSCPVINGLSEYAHPCQALADLYTIHEVFGAGPGDPRPALATEPDASANGPPSAHPMLGLAGRTVTFVGDGNNVARSLAVGCAKLGLRFILTAPPGYGFDSDFLETLARNVPEAAIIQDNEPEHAVEATDIIYTDVWASMGHEAEHDIRLRHFAKYQVNARLLSHAPPHARVMHCLPAHRGEEITSDVLDGERSIAIQQAANRLHANKALLQWLLAS